MEGKRRELLGGWVLRWVRGCLVLPAVCLLAELEAEFLGEAAGLGHAVEVTSGAAEPAHTHSQQAGHEWGAAPMVLSQYQTTTTTTTKYKKKKKKKKKKKQ